MTNARTLLVGFLMAGLTACSSTEPAGTPALLVLGIGQSATLAGGRTITLVEVPEDSRCPIDATCVWAGNLAVVLGAQPPGLGPTTMLRVNTGLEPRQVGWDGLLFSIDRALPEPRAEQVIDPDDYRVTLRITRQ